MEMQSSLIGKVNFKMGPNLGTLVKGHPEIDPNMEFCKIQDCADYKKGSDGAESQMLGRLRYYIPGLDKLSYEKLNSISRETLALGQPCVAATFPQVFDLFGLEYPETDEIGCYVEDPYLVIDKHLSEKKDKSFDPLRIAAFAWAAIGQDEIEAAYSSLKMDGLLEQGLLYSLRQMCRSAHYQKTALLKTLANSEELQGFVHPLLKEYAIPFLVEKVAHKIKNKDEYNAVKTNLGL